MKLILGRVETRVLRLFAKTHMAIAILSQMTIPLTRGVPRFVGHERAVEAQASEGQGWALWGNLGCSVPLLCRRPCSWISFEKCDKSIIYITLFR